MSGWSGATGKGRDRTIRRPFLVNRLGAEKRATAQRPGQARPAAEAGQVRPSVSSSGVKFRQVLSSFVKPLLDGARCNFNALPAPWLTSALRGRLGRPTPLGTFAGDEARIARLPPSANNLSASPDQNALKPLALRTWRGAPSTSCRDGAPGSRALLRPANVSCAVMSSACYAGRVPLALMSGVGCGLRC